MAKFRVTLTNSSSDSEGKTIGTYADVETAAEHGYAYAHDNGYTSTCDKKEDVIGALIDRNYYMLAYGPRELEISMV